MTQVERLRAMLRYDRNTDFLNNGRENATHAVEALNRNAASMLAVLTLLDEIEAEDTAESLDKAGM